MARPYPKFRLTQLPYYGAHVLALAGALYVGVSWISFLAFVASYAIGMFAVTGGYHRYFSHRTYRTGRVFQFILAFVAQSTSQKGALWWAANHRHHHRYSDQPEDIHSPVVDSFWYSHQGWILCRENDPTDYARIQDFARFPELVWLNKYWFVPPLVGSVLVWGLFGFEIFVWAGLVRTVALWHGTFFINSLAHVFGRQRYETGEESKNSFLLALITLGEGWHNNHHHYMHSANQGFYWWEIDLTYYALWTLEKLGVISHLKRAPSWAVEGKRRRHDESLHLIGSRESEASAKLAA